jgi:glycosyltransferase involved in cell wall biosynthesis
MDPLYVLQARLDSNDIVLCHDVGPVSHPELFDATTSDLYTRAYKKIHGVRPGMVFVSHASRDAFQARFGSAFRFMRVIPLYVRQGAAEGPVAQPKGVKPPFLLTVGAFERRKNLPRAIEAFAISGLAGQGFSYVLCGARGLDNAQVVSAAESAAGVTTLAYVSEPELRWLFQHASGFVLPSLLEGFGMPVLEAARYGLTSIIPPGGALAEAVGHTALFADPFSPPAIAQSMRDLIETGREEAESRAMHLREHARAASREAFLARWDNLLAGKPAAAPSAPGLM